MHRMWKYETQRLFFSHWFPKKNQSLVNRDGGPWNSSTVSPYIYIYHTRPHKCWLLARTLHNSQLIFTLWWVKHVIITKKMYIFNCEGFKQIICIWRLLFDRYICVSWHSAVSCTFLSVLKSMSFFYNLQKNVFW